MSDVTKEQQIKEQDTVSRAMRNRRRSRLEKIKGFLKKNFGPDITRKMTNIKHQMLNIWIIGKVWQLFKIKDYAANYLRGRGWQDSVVHNQPINQNGPIPWITYPALSFLERNISPHHKVFEYGCGFSSLWWGRNVSEVVSAEHNVEWAIQVSAQATSNVRVSVKRLDDQPEPTLAEFSSDFFKQKLDLPLSGDFEHDLTHGLICDRFIAYATEIARYGKGYFDIVVVDGMARSLCSWLAADFVKENGFIIFDNSERWQYNRGFEALEKRGFKRLDFYGPGPINTHEWCTSIFCRNLEWMQGANQIPMNQTSDLGW